MHPCFSSTSNFRAQIKTDLLFLKQHVSADIMKLSDQTLSAQGLVCNETIFTGGLRLPQGGLHILVWLCLLRADTFDLLRHGNCCQFLLETSTVNKLGQWDMPITWKQAKLNMHSKDVSEELIILVSV